MKTVAFMFGIVVYHLVPTSNHNWSSSMYKFGELYIILFLHQTTTAHFGISVPDSLYIILFLHQTTTACNGTISNAQLYIILFLHQTTTLGFAPYGDSSLYIILFLHQTTTIYSEYRTKVGCISSCSYIKPQPTVMK